MSPIFVITRPAPANVSLEAFAAEPFSVYNYPAPQETYDPDRDYEWTECYGATPERAKELMRDHGAYFEGDDTDHPYPEWMRA